MSDPWSQPETLVRSVCSQMAGRIGLGIVRGDFPPGEPLPSEMKICEMMGVSRTVVREAIRMLAGKGMLESRPKSGTRVRPPECWNYLDAEVQRWHLEAEGVDAYLVKLFQLRRAVEPAAAVLAAAARTEDDLERIRAAFEVMAAATDNARFAAADVDYHKAIYTATRNELFWPIAQMFGVVAEASFRLAATGSHRSRALAEHRDLLEAIAVGDGRRARDIASALLDSSADDLVAITGHDPFRG